MPRRLRLPTRATPIGTNRHKYGVRAVFRGSAFVSLLFFFSAYNYYDTGTWTKGPIERNSNSSTKKVEGPAAAPLLFRTALKDESILPRSRRLQDAVIVEGEEDNSEGACDLDVADPKWKLVFYIIGVLYMFLALAIVCDEFFVPTLEEMSSERRLNLSMDVAGATLMAAGGSAPELFTSLIGTFQESEVGIGTIVGSAVFNVLFVIACCSLLSKELLQLTWWPLFRDSSYYALGLVVLAIFIGVLSPGVIELWEAIVLFVMYLGYVTVMFFNRKIYKFITKKDLPKDGEEADHAAGDSGTGENGDNFDQENDKGNEDGDSADASLHSSRSVNFGTYVNSHRNNHDFRWPGTFRAGVLKLLREPKSWVTTAGVGIVAKMAGDSHSVFQTVDINGDGKIDRDELERLFSQLDCHISRDEMDGVFRELDPNEKGFVSFLFCLSLHRSTLSLYVTVSRHIASVFFPSFFLQITEQEFSSWYILSEERIKDKVEDLFKTFDVDKSGTIDRKEVRSLLETLEPRVTDSDINDAFAAMYKEGSREEITFEEFSSWYLNSVIFQQQKSDAEEDFEGVCAHLKPPSGGNFFSYLQWIVVLPIVATLVLTIPDVSRPGWSKWCYLSFTVSIGWIGCYSYFMVTWTSLIGNTIGIPSVVMGLTFLAAGTSIPDLFSSVIVARKGQGDMAVSSSIGSNIFDILVGLPVPWVIFTAVKGKNVTIGAKNIWINIFILLGMLVLIIGVIHCQGWKLTKRVGAIMLMFYFAFLVVAIWLEVPFQLCSS